MEGELPAGSVKAVGMVRMPIDYIYLQWVGPWVYDGLCLSTCTMTPGFSSEALVENFQGSGTGFTLYIHPLNTTTPSCLE